MNQFSASNIFDFEPSDSFSTGIQSSSPQSDKENFPFSQQSLKSRDDSPFSSESRKIRKKRNAYQKIDDDIRLELLDAVQKNGETLKAASKRLNINYSSAKSILHTYRKEGRILKKSALERPAGFFPFTTFDINIGSIEENTFMKNDCNRIQTGMMNDALPVGFQYELQPSHLNSHMPNSSNFMDVPADNFNTNLICNYFQKVKSDNPHNAKKFDFPFIMTQGSRCETSTQDSDLPLPLMPSLSFVQNQGSSNPLDHLKHLDNFYMNYSDSPLSGGKANIVKDHSNPGSRSYNKREFDSFTEMVTSFQIQSQVPDEPNNESQVFETHKFNGSIFKKDFPTNEILE